MIGLSKLHILGLYRPILYLTLSCWAVDDRCKIWAFTKLACDPNLKDLFVNLVLSRLMVPFNQPPYFYLLSPAYSSVYFWPFIWNNCINHSYNHLYSGKLFYNNLLSISAIWFWIRTTGSTYDGTTL